MTFTRGPGRSYARSAALANVSVPAIRGGRGLGLWGAFWDTDVVGLGQVGAVGS